MSDGKAIEVALKKARNTGAVFTFPTLTVNPFASAEEKARLEPYNPHKSPQKSKAGPPPKPRKGGSRRRKGGKGRKTRNNRG